MQRPILLTAALVVALALAGPTQDPPSDYYVSAYRPSGTPHCCARATLVRITPTGAATLLGSTTTRGWFPYVNPTPEHTNRSIHTVSMGRLLEFDPATDTIRRSVPVPLSAWGLTRHHATGLTIAVGGTLLHMPPGLSTMTTIGSVSTASIVSLYERDLWSGDYIASDFSSSLMLVSVDGRRVRRIGSGIQDSYNAPAGVAQSHVDGDLRLYLPSSPQQILGIERIDPRTGQQSPIVRSGGLSAAVLFETAFGPGVIHNVRGVGTTALLIETRLPNGTVIGTIPVTAVGFLDPLAMCRANGRVLSTERTAQPNRWDIRLDSPLDAGLPYVVALSATGFTPGIRVGARTLALVPDALFALSIRGALGPLFTGNIGVLPAAGVANATLDLRRFGNALSGLRIWTAAAIFDPAAPNGIRRITRPEILVLD